MQESHVIKALKAQKSTTSVATCDPDGDDSHCPPITPEKHQFFIRTGTQMSCANSGAATFLKNSKLSHLNVEARDIIDKRSRVPSLFNKNRSSESREKFSGRARVKVALVAWTTVESKHHRFSRFSSSSPRDSSGSNIIGIGVSFIIGVGSNSFEFPGEDPFINTFRSGNFYGNLITKVTRGLLRITSISLGRLNKAVQGSFVDHFKTRQTHYKNLDEENLKNPQQSGNTLLQHNTVGIAVLPPLSVQMHTLAYDDEVMANAGDALLRCVNEGTEENQVFFDADLDVDKKVCLSESQWMEKKSNSTPDELATHNKKLLYTYFKQVYGNYKNGPYRRFPRGTEPFPTLVFSTHFAVQSCQNYAQNTEHNINRKTAHQVINEINEEIKNVYQIIRRREKLTKDNTNLYRLFEQYKPRLIQGNLQNNVDITSPDYKEKKAVLSSPFYWTLRIFEKVREKYIQAESKVQNGTTIGEIIKIYSDLRFHNRVQAGSKRGYRFDNVHSDNIAWYVREVRTEPKADGLLHENFGGMLYGGRDGGVRSCYDVRELLTYNAKWVYYYDQNPDQRFSYRGVGTTQWFTNSEDQTMFRNLLGYSPKWWEYTDLGYACKLLAGGLFLKNFSPLKGLYRDFVGLNYYRNNRSAKSLPLGQQLPREWVNLVRKNITELDKIIELLKVTVGLEVLEAKYQHYGPKNKACSPDTKTYRVTENKTPPEPHWHNVFSSAVLDMRQNFDDPTSKPFKIFSSQHPSAGFSTDALKQYLMTKDPLYLTFYSSEPDLEENYHPGLPMIMVPGTEYIAPEVVADESSTPSSGYSGKYGISVYSYPPAVCNLATTEHRGIKRPHRIWN